MVLNYIWISFFLISLVVGLVKLIFFGDTLIFTTMVTSTFDTAASAFTIAIGLTGALTLWSGLMKVGEEGGVIAALAKVVHPFFSRLFPDVPHHHPVHGSIIMNFSANMLGLDNAATPLGLKAMGELQELNPVKDTASNAQIMFLVLNAGGLTILPISVLVLRAQAGAANPADVFLPILLATFCGTMTGMILVCLRQRINLLDPVLLAHIVGAAAVVFGLLGYFSSLPQEQIQSISGVAANVILFSVISGFIGLAALRRVNVYDAFIEGGKEGFATAIRIVPYLVAILVAVGVFRASGTLDLLVNGVGSIFGALGVNTDFVPGLPTALMKSLSGSGARGLMVDAMKVHGPDSFVGRLVSTYQGCSDTTFYILALYFGSVGVKNTRYALSMGLLSDLAAVVAATLIAYLYFH